jgi:hypothetical protein
MMMMMMMLMMMLMMMMIIIIIIIINFSRTSQSKQFVHYKDRPVNASCRNAICLLRASYKTLSTVGS